MKARPARHAVHRGSRYPNEDRMVSKAIIALEGIRLCLEAVNVRSLDAAKKQELSEAITALDAWLRIDPGLDVIPTRNIKPSPPSADVRSELDLARREEAYRKKNNPLDAWFAYLTAREAGLSIPEWVLVYFDAAAVRFRELCRSSADTWDARGHAAHTTLPRLRDQAPTDVRPAVSEVLGFKRDDGKRGNAFLSVDDEGLLARDLILAFAVDRCLRDRKGQRGARVRGDDDVYETVANQLRSSRPTVARAWARHKATVEEFRRRG